MSYLDILKSGGGILKTVRETNRASDEDLISQTRKRLERMLSFGTTTAEVKTGYSLTVSGEIRMLELLEKLRIDSGYDIESTLLSAHAIPPEYSGKKESYLSEVVVPSDQCFYRKKLASFCDVFLEEGVFEYGDAESILNHAARVGLLMKIHADEIFGSTRRRTRGETQGYVCGSFRTIFVGRNFCASEEWCGGRTAARHSVLIFRWDLCESKTIY